MPCEVRVRRQEGIGAATALAACRGGVDCRLGAGHGEERTVNMLPMFVTLDVSRLSGWLNANATCRANRRAYACEARAGRRQGVGRRRRKRHAREGPTKG